VVGVTRAGFGVTKLWKGEIAAMTRTLAKVGHRLQKGTWVAGNLQDIKASAMQGLLVLVKLMRDLHAHCLLSQGAGCSGSDDYLGRRSESARARSGRGGRRG
jgi:hypothetical protein